MIWYDYGYNFKMAKDILHVTVPHYTRTNYIHYLLTILKIYYTYGVNRLSDKSTCSRLHTVTNVYECLRVAKSAIRVDANSADSGATLKRKTCSARRKMVDCLYGAPIDQFPS